MVHRTSPEVPSPSVNEPTPSGRARKRLYIACRRCHSLKVKCSGGVPCQRCAKARNVSTCQYPPRVRRVTVSATYLNELQNVNERGSAGEHPDQAMTIAENAEINVAGGELPAAAPTTAEPSRATSQALPVDPDLGSADQDISNPFREPDRIFQIDQSSGQHFVGESTCLAFGDRILECLDPQGTRIPRSPTLPPTRGYVSNPAFARQSMSVEGCRFPERIRANLLVRVALRFIGQDYHFFLHDDFLQKLDKAYDSRQNHQHDPVWACKFFVVLALGEMYSASLPAGKEARPTTVPGTTYFMTAVGLLQDLFEEPSISQIENLLLFCFYSNALGRVKSAHMYSGMAVRLSTCLGLHRALPNASVLSPMEREHRVRLWWTVYVFDRSTCSKLGQPLTIQDADIDVEMPSAEVAGSESQTKLGSPDHLIAYINLAQITGFIMRDIYAPSSKSNGVKFVQNVRSILQRLKKWDVHSPSNLRWRAEGGVPRPVASLQLHFNQCIMLATRPILLHVLKVKDPFGDHCAGTPSAGSWPRLSDTARSLADSCIAAARTSNSILSQLFVENALATCGYFDAHHLFSSTLVLVISAIVSPNSGDSDAVQTAFQLLMVMRDNGNAAAGQYFSRLIKLQWSVSRLFTRATATVEEANISADAQPHPPSISASPQFPPSASAEFDDYDWSNLLLPHSFYANFDEEQAAAGNITADPLDNPILQAFLEGTDTSLDGNSVF